MSQRYKKLPSEILHIKDEYIAYCLDECCAYIMGRLDSGEEIKIKKHYSSFTEMYADYK